MSILLFEHNLKAFNAVKIAWNTSNKTCVIHATGTGKSLIISKNIEENPIAKHLFLSPSTFIFDEIKKHLTKAVSQKVLFQSYAYLLDKKDLEEEFLNLDFIYLDEFHRVGATKWGNAVQNVLSANPKARVLGTSATPIRYLDDNRNMAEELFDNNIASELPLGEAILQGIHKKPKYVTTLYNHSDILSKTRNKIQKSNLDDIKKNQELERLRSVEINWNSSKGIDTIIKKYLNVERKKILIFCRDTEHRKEALKLLQPVLDKLYKSKIDYFAVGSDLSEKTNFDIISSFRKDVKQTSVLFSVNMLNEGLHIDGTDTCIFFRDTESPIIYFQQLGRVFHTNQIEQPLIIDLINNFKLSYGRNIFAKNALESFGEKTQKKLEDLNLIIDFHDEIKDFSEVVDSFKIEPWEIRYEELKMCYTNLNNYPVSNIALMKWVNKQKTSFNNNTLSQYRIELLLSIIPDFFEKQRTDWFIRYEEFKTYFKTYKICPNEKGSSLERWIKRQKAKFNNNELSKEKIDLLLEITPDFFEGQFHFNWNIKYNELQLYFEDKGKLPGQNENELGVWVSAQKVRFNDNTLSKNRIDLLLGITPYFFENLIDLLWTETYMKIKIYFEKNNKLPVKSEGSLGLWVIRQRTKFNKDTLSQERIDLFLKITPDFFEKKK